MKEVSGRRYRKEAGTEQIRINPGPAGRQPDSYGEKLGNQWALKYSEDQMPIQRQITILAKTGRMKGKYVAITEDDEDEFVDNMVEMVADFYEDEYGEAQETMVREYLANILAEPVFHKYESQDVLALTICEWLADTMDEKRKTESITMPMAVMPPIPGMPPMPGMLSMPEMLSMPPNPEISPLPVIPPMPVGLQTPPLINESYLAAAFLEGEVIPTADPKPLFQSTFLYRTMSYEEYLAVHNNCTMLSNGGFYSPNPEYCKKFYGSSNEYTVLTEFSFDMPIGGILKGIPVHGHNEISDLGGTFVPNDQTKAPYHIKQEPEPAVVNLQLGTRTEEEPGSAGFEKKRAEHDRRLQGQEGRINWKIPELEAHLIGIRIIGCAPETVGKLAAMNRKKMEQEKIRKLLERTEHHE